MTRAFKTTFSVLALAAAALAVWLNTAAVNDTTDEMEPRRYRHGPLHNAVGMGDIELVRKLLEEGEDPNKGLGDGWYEPETTPVDVAIMRGEMKILQLLLEKGGELAADMVEVAAGAGQLEMVKWLVNERGLPADSPGFQGESPLYSAVRNGRKEVAAWLAGRTEIDSALARRLGLLIGQKGEFAFGILKDAGALENKETLQAVYLEALRSGAVSIVEESLQLGAAAEFPSSDRGNGNTLIELPLPSDERMREALKLAIGAGARADIPALEWLHANNSKDEIPQDAASFYRDAGAFEGVELPGPDRMMLAALCRDGAEIQRLADEGVDPSAKTSGGWLPLSMAIMYCDTPTVRALLEAGAEPNPEVQYSNHLPLVQASQYGEPGMLEALIEAGVDVDTPIKGTGATGTSTLLAGASVENMQVLLEAGADVNAMPGGITPLFAMARWPRGSEGTRFLLDAGADPNLVCWNGWTALDAAIAGNNPQCAELIREFGGKESGNRIEGERYACNLESALREGSVGQAEFYVEHADNLWPDMLKQALEKGADELAVKLIERGALLNKQGKIDFDALRWSDPLVSAVKSGSLKTTAALLDAGLDVDQRDREGRSLLTITGEDWNQPLIELLIEHGADFAWENPHVYVAKGRLDRLKELVIVNPKAMTVKDPNGYRALHWAAAFGRREIAEFLILKGSPLEFDDDRLSPSELARRTGHEELLELLSGNEQVKKPTVRVAPWYEQQKRREAEQKK